MTLDLSPALQQELQAIAAHGHYSVDEIAQQAIENFIAIAETSTPLSKKAVQQLNAENS